MENLQTDSSAVPARPLESGDAEAHQPLPRVESATLPRPFGLRQLWNPSVAWLRARLGRTVHNS